MSSTLESSVTGETPFRCWFARSPNPLLRTHAVPYSALREPDQPRKDGSMHIGKGVFFQNLSGERTDAEVMHHELSLADRAEADGFQSLWAAEHHFTGYHMCPSVTQILTYLAGRTTSVRLGSMVVVLPWHEPVRVAEELSVL